MCPHFDDEGNETVLCQLCGRSVTKADWRPDLTENASAGNVCHACIDAHVDKIVARSARRQDEAAIGIVEHCRRESGLTGPALTRYINRYYGHG